MSETTQISAHIPKVIKERMERYVRMTGVTRTHLIEQALAHHLQALEELPADAITPTRLVLTLASAERVGRLLDEPPAPTEDLRQLFDDR